MNRLSLKGEISRDAQMYQEKEVKEAIGKVTRK